MWMPQGDLIVIEKIKIESSLILPDNIAQQDNDMYIVKAVGIGYVTDNGMIIAPEVKVGDKVIVRSKVLTINTGIETFLLARAQDVLCYERSNNETNSGNSLSDSADSCI